MKKFRTLSFLIVFVFILCSSVFASDVKIVRDDSESPFISVAKSTFYGALAGTVIALAIMLVADDDDGDIFKVAFISGTGLGLGYGIFHVATRPSANADQALLQFENSKLKRVMFPTPLIRLKRDQTKSVEVSLLAVKW